EGTTELHGDPSLPTSTNGHVDLRAVDVALEGGKIRGITVPDLHFPELHLAGTVKAGRLELEQLVANGRELNAQGEGHVLLQNPLAASLINLTLVLRPAADLPDNLRL